MFKKERKKIEKAPTGLWGQLPPVPRRWTEVAHDISAALQPNPSS